MDETDPFEEQRPRLFGLAYRLLGSAADAEDVVQEAFLRWDAADRAAIVSPQAWLVTVVTRLGLSVLTSARRRRETYVGPWLPEPVLTAGGALGPLETVEQRESVSWGVLVLLEELTPPERAVFVLHEAFGHPHGEIAELLGVDEATSRQHLHRARRHIAAGRRRFDVDQVQHRRVLERFLGAAFGGGTEDLEDLLAADVVSWADGGGTRAARRPVTGREKVARYLRGLTTLPDVAGVAAEVAEVNGEPAVLFRTGDGLAGVMVVEVGEGGIVALRTVVNPPKLSFAAAQQPV